MLEDIKKELLIEGNERDEEILLSIEISLAIVQSFLNNPNVSIDDKLVYLAVKYLTVMLVKDETRLSESAGKVSENMGVQINYIDTLPSYIAEPLKRKYFKVVIR